MMLARPRAVVAAGALAILSSAIPSLAAAQRSVAFSADVGFAAGSGRGGDYRDRGIGGWRVGGSLRIRQSATRIGFLEVARESFDIRSGHLAICVLQPSGECVPTYPGFSVVAATIGTVLLRPQWELRAGLGGGSFATDDRGRTRVGGIVGQIDAALFITPRVGLVGGIRPFVIPSFRHDPLWIVPLAVGIRIR